MMGSLVVVGFPKAEEAEQVRRELVDIQREQLIALEDAVVVEHDVLVAVEQVDFFILQVLQLLLSRILLL